ncbi:MAG: hypothetical protein LBI03_00535 [Clostridiales bacterium]|jgi:hypothetical protein|nr:hypothetical protein [Clostridiales bacterium]
MDEVKNLDHKRVCDISNDQKTVEIHKKNCITRITVNSNGTLNIINERIDTNT